MEKVKLSTIVDIQIGKTPSRNKIEYWGEGTDWLSIANLNNLEDGKYITKSSEQITDIGISKSGSKLVPENTVLYSFKLSIGKVAITKKPFFTNEAIAALTLRPSSMYVSVDYLFYALKSLKTNYKIDIGAKGGTLNKKSLGNLLIYLPDRNTQHKIVAILDRIYYTIVKREKSLEVYEKIIKSIFLDFFGASQKKDNNWRTVSFQDIIKKTQYGTSSPLLKEKMGVPVLRMNNLTYDGNIDLTDLKWLKLSNTKLDALKLNDRDILFNRTNSRELVGKTAVWDKPGLFVFAGYLIRIVVNEKIVNPYFVCGFLNSDYGKRILYNYAKSSGNLTNFSPPLLEKQKLFIPPLEIQRKYESKIRKVKLAKVSLGYSLKEMNLILSSVMQRIFNGEDLIKEENIFEDLLKGLVLKDFEEKKERINYLANLINKNEIRKEENYEKAKTFAFELLEIKKSGLTQVYNHKRKKIELITTV